MKWLETINGYVAVDDAKEFTISDVGSVVLILMWVDDNADNCIVVSKCHYGGELDFYKTSADAVSDAKRELEFIINYISDGDVCAYEQYTQHTNIRYVEEVND